MRGLLDGFFCCIVFGETPRPNQFHLNRAESALSRANLRDVGGTKALASCPNTVTHRFSEKTAWARRRPPLADPTPTSSFTIVASVRWRGFFPAARDATKRHARHECGGLPRGRATSGKLTRRRAAVCGLRLSRSRTKVGEELVAGAVGTIEPGSGCRWRKAPIQGADTVWDWVGLKGGVAGCSSLTWSSVSGAGHGLPAMPTTCRGRALSSAIPVVKSLERRMTLGEALLCVRIVRAREAGSVMFVGHRGNVGRFRSTQADHRPWTRRSRAALARRTPAPADRGVRRERPASTMAVDKAPTAGRGGGARELAPA